MTPPSRPPDAPRFELPLLVQTIVDSVTEGLTVQDRAGRIVFANDLAARLVGLPNAAALLDPKPGEVMSRFEIFGEDGQPVPFDALPGRVLIAGGSPQELLLRFRDRGTRVERWARVRAVPVLEGGELAYAINLFHDITAERQAAQRQAFMSRVTEELNASLDWEKTLKTIARLAVPTVADWCAVDMIVDGKTERLAVAHVDPEKIALVQDIERRYPANPNAATGTPNIRRTGKAEWVREIPQAALAAGSRDAEYLELIQKLELRSYIGVPLKRADQVVGVITFIYAESQRLYAQEDVQLASALAERASIAIENARLYRELANAHSAAQAANRAKDEFLAVLGHELRNPLAPIGTALDLMQQRAPKLLEREREIVMRQVRHLVRLVDDMLDVSRITRGSVELALEPLVVADVIARAIEMSSPLLEQRAQHLDVSVDAALFVSGDPARLAQVVSNLLTNSSKYSDRGGRVQLTARREDLQVVMQVQDDGIGIAPATLPHVFEVFVQERQAIDRAQGGLGLGLSIVQNLVRAHGGTVTAHSEGIGKGSRFEVRLPALEHMPAAAAAMRAPRHTTSSASGARVLVVDDNTDALELMCEALKDAGFVVESAANGPAALASAARQPPQVAVLDIGLPVMDGYELARRLRASTGLEALKLIALTGYGQASDKKLSQEAGFDAHLVKPVSITHMIETIERLAPRLP